MLCHPRVAGPVLLLLASALLAVARPGSAVTSPDNAAVLRQATRAEVVERMLIADGSPSAKRATVSPSLQCSFPNGFAILGQSGSSWSWAPASGEPDGGTIVLSNAEGLFALSGGTLSLADTNPPWIVAYSPPLPSSQLEVYPPDQLGSLVPLTCSVTPAVSGDCPLSCGAPGYPSLSFLECYNPDATLWIVDPSQPEPAGCYLVPFYAVSPY